MEAKKFSPEQIISFFMDPGTFLEEHFKSKWDSILGNEVDKYKKDFYDTVKNEIKRFRSIFTQLIKLFEKVIGLSIEYFVIQDVFD